jgi:6-phosphofructokinase
MTPGGRGPFGNSERRIQSFGHLRHAALGVDYAQQTLAAVELHQGLGFILIYLEPFGDRVLIVVGTLKEPMRCALFRTDLLRGAAALRRAHIEDAFAITAGAPAGDAPHKLGAVYIHQYDAVERLPKLREHGIQGRRLFDVARKAIEHKSLTHIGRTETLGDDAKNDAILDKTAGVHGGLGAHAQGRARGNRGAQQVAGGDLRHAPFLRQTLRLSALARARRTQQNYSHNRRARPTAGPPRYRRLPARSNERAQPCHHQRGCAILASMKKPAPKNAFYAQSGGVSAVINASACGVIETAKRHPKHIGKLFAGRDGIVGALTENLIDVSRESAATIRGLKHTPAGAFGSARFKLRSLEQNRAEYERLIEVFRAHDIGYFFYNGGNDSMDTALKVSQIGAALGFPITCVGVPKTVDNDLPHTDCCPGFGSVAKYVAISTLEAGLDVASMARTSTKVFVLEVMGRHAGWIAAAGGLAGAKPAQPPHIILFPEIPFVPQEFLERVKQCVSDYGYCVVVASEGAAYADGKFLADAGTKDAFGHTQLGGVAPVVANMIRAAHGYKYHWAVADYLQRAARHVASRVDVEQAYAVGKAAVELAVQGVNAVMPTIVRRSSRPYKWSIGHVPLDQVANVEKKLPRSFITADGFGITAPCRRYLEPLIGGEAPPPYRNGLPEYVRIKGVAVRRKLKDEFKV